MNTLEELEELAKPPLIMAEAEAERVDLQVTVERVVTGVQPQQEQVVEVEVVPTAEVLVLMEPQLLAEAVETTI